MPPIHLKKPAFSPLTKSLQKSDEEPGTDSIEIGSEDGKMYDYVGATMADADRLISELKFLLRGWIPFGMLTGLVGEPGCGKSALALWLARTVAMGGRWFNGTRGPKPSKILWCPTESDLAITRDRMRKWKIPAEQFVLRNPDDPLESVDLTNSGHIQGIEGLISKYQTPLVVIDSLRGGHNLDENSSIVNSILKTLAETAEKTRAAILVVHHTKKLSEDEELTAGSSRGSNAIIAMFRSLLGVDRPAGPRSEWARFRLLKENLGINPGPVGFKISNAGVEFGPPPEKPQRTTAVKQRAMQFLETHLVAGEWILAAPLVEKAQAEGISENALFRARKDLGVTKEEGNVRDNDEGRSEWRLV